MARRGRTSIVCEVKESLTAIDKIGQSKRDAKKAGTSGIHSKKQMTNTMSDAQNFVKWCRSEHGVKSIAELDERHYMSYRYLCNHVVISTFLISPPHVFSPSLLFFDAKKSTSA